MITIITDFLIFDRTFDEQVFIFIKNDNNALKPVEETYTFARTAKTIKMLNSGLFKITIQNNTKITDYLLPSNKVVFRFEVVNLCTAH